MARSTYYFEVSPHGVDETGPNRKLMRIIALIHRISKGRYGVRKVWGELWFRWHIAVNYKKVARMMRKLGLQGAFRKGRRYRSYKGTVGKVADNLLERDFKADAPNRKWTTDVSEFKCPFGKAYLSPIKDMFDGLIVAYDLSETPDFSQTIRMLDRAFEANPEVRGLIFHSDQGWQYQMRQYGERLSAEGIRQSMSRKGNCLDNGIMESFFGTMKNEMFHGHEDEFQTFDDLKRAVDAYIAWYNSKRIAERLGWQTPLTFRNKWFERNGTIAV